MPITYTFDRLEDFVTDVVEWSYLLEQQTSGSVVYVHKR